MLAVDAYKVEAEKILASGYGVILLDIARQVEIVDDVATNHEDE